MTNKPPAAQTAGSAAAGSTFVRIWETVRRIPRGRVTTYGTVAALVGNPRLARIVGCALHAAPPDLP
ncbi:MAG: MGMT family protein, partial [Clostridia bacterium]|nr:MGMT family protein [Clostridia bacterium]